jgi:4a-hydroxytetrahydrobiopterin dehydratase
MPQRLDEAAITARLGSLTGWERQGDEIAREVKAPDFLTGAVSIVTEIAHAAEEADHHPDIDIRWRTLKIALTTHDAGGLTERDFDLAARIDEIAAKHNAI